MALYNSFSKGSASFTPSVEFDANEFYCIICGTIPETKKRMPCDKVEHEICPDCASKSFRDGHLSCQYCAKQYPAIRLADLKDSDTHNLAMRICKMECQFCKMKASPHEMDKHQWECPSFPMECLVCKQSNIKRSEMEAHMLQSATEHVRALADKAKQVGAKIRGEHKHAIAMSFMALEEKASEQEKITDLFRTFQQETDVRIKEMGDTVKERTREAEEEHRNMMEELQRKHERKMKGMEFRNSCMQLASEDFLEWAKITADINNTVRYNTDFLDIYSGRLTLEEMELAKRFLKGVKNIVKLVRDITDQEMAPIDDFTVFADSVRALEFENPRSTAVYQFLPNVMQDLGMQEYPLPAPTVHVEGTHNLETLENSAKESLDHLKNIARVNILHFFGWSIPKLEVLHAYLSSKEKMPPVFKSYYYDLQELVDSLRCRMESFYRIAPGSHASIHNSRSRFLQLVVEISILAEMQLTSETNSTWNMAHRDYFDAMNLFMTNNNMVGRFKHYHEEVTEPRSKRQRTNAVGEAGPSNSSNNDL